MTHCCNNTSVSERRITILSAETKKTNSHVLTHELCLGLQLIELVNSMKTFAQAEYVVPFALNEHRFTKTTVLCRDQILFIKFTRQRTEFTEAKQDCEGRNIIIQQRADGGSCNNVLIALYRHSREHAP